MNQQDRKLMQQALDALEIYGAMTTDVSDTITALRRALEQSAPVPEAHKQEPVAIGLLMRGQAILQWNRAQAEPPIAVTKELWVAEQLEQFYTRPQARERLTDEEIGKAFDDYMEGRFSTGFNGSVRAIEAKLKEKNGF